MPINPKPIEKTEKPEQSLRLNFDISLPKYTFDDVILSSDTRDELDKLAVLERYKKKIYDDWGLACVMKNKKSITANFYGESGTGKTMSAHALASKLNKKILVVNYADIESKYVGETSKNLADLFMIAQKTDAVLFLMRQMHYYQKELLKCTTLRM